MKLHHNGSVFRIAETDGVFTVVKMLDDGDGGIEETLIGEFSSLDQAQAAREAEIKLMARMARSV